MTRIYLKKDSNEFDCKVLTFDSNSITCEVRATLADSTVYNFYADINKTATDLAITYTTPATSPTLTTKSSSTFAAVASLTITFEVSDFTGVAAIEVKLLSREYPNSTFTATSTITTEVSSVFTNVSADIYDISAFISGTGYSVITFTNKITINADSIASAAHQASFGGGKII